MTHCCCSLAILHCYKEGPDNLDLAAVVNVFISKQRTKKSISRRFSKNDFV